MAGIILLFSATDDISSSLFNLLSRTRSGGGGGGLVDLAYVILEFSLSYAVTQVIPKMGSFLTFLRVCPENKGNLSVSNSHF